MTMPLLYYSLVHTLATYTNKDIENLCKNPVNKSKRFLHNRVNMNCAPLPEQRNWGSAWEYFH